jgi:hypothetical protein
LRAAETRWWIGVGSGILIALLLTGLFWGFSEDPSLPRPGRIVIREKNFAVSLDSRGVLRGVGPIDAHYRDTMRLAMQSRNLRLPASGLVISEDQPTLAWNPLPDAEAYEVTVREESSGRTSLRVTTKDSQLRVMKPLARGIRFTWQVQARLKGAGATGLKPPTGFRVADSEVLGVLNGLPKSLTLRGVVFAESGLFEAAQLEFEELRRLNPHSAVVASWIDQLGSRIRSEGACVTRICENASLKHDAKH